MRTAPTICISKYGDKFSVRMEWEKEEYLRVNNLKALIKLIEKTFGED